MSIIGSEEDEMVKSDSGDKHEDGMGTSCPWLFAPPSPRCGGGPGVRGSHRSESRVSRDPPHPALPRAGGREEPATPAKPDKLLGKAGEEPLISLRTHRWRPADRGRGGIRPSLFRVKAEGFHPWGDGLHAVRGFTLIEVLIGTLILASAGVALTRALASIATTDAAAMTVLAEGEAVRDELNQVETDLVQNPEERRPEFFNRDLQPRDRPGWTIRTRCRATVRDPERLWEVQTTIEGGRWKTSTTTWFYRPPLPTEGAAQ